MTTPLRSPRPFAESRARTAVASAAARDGSTDHRTRNQIDAGVACRAQHFDVCDIGEKRHRMQHPRAGADASDLVDGIGRRSACEVDADGMDAQSLIGGKGERVQRHMHEHGFGERAQHCDQIVHPAVRHARRKSGDLEQHIGPNVSGQVAAGIGKLHARDRRTQQFVADRNRKQELVPLAQALRQDRHGTSDCRQGLGEPVANMLFGR